MSKLKSFPSEIFVTSEEEGTEDHYKQVHDTANEVAVGLDLHTPKRVGRYLLAEILKVEALPKVSVESSHRHPNCKRK
jgi:hypothetical protein